MRRLWTLAIAAVLGVLLSACGGGSSTSEGTASGLPPLQVAAAAEDGATTVSWDAVPGAVSYNLYWSTTTPVTTASNVITGAVSPFHHTGLANGTTVYYAVAAVSWTGQSTLSREVGARPFANRGTAPASVASIPGNQQVALLWNPVPGATSYTIYWSTSPGVTPATGTAIPVASATSFAHVGLTNGVTYHYVVTATSASGESAASVEVTATPQAPAQAVVQNLAAVAGDSRIALAWSPALNATSYNVYWAKSPGVTTANGTRISGLTATGYTHTGLTNGDTYYYVVTAVASGTEGAASAEVSAQPLPAAPSAPIGLTAIAARDTAMATVQWFDVVYSVQPVYTLYRGRDPGLASYYKDPARAMKLVNVTAPYEDRDVSSNTTYYYVVTASHPAFPNAESGPSTEVSVSTARAGGGGTEGGGEDAAFGSNLSFPLIFADAYGISGLPITGTWPGAGPFSSLPTMDYNTGLRPLSTEPVSSLPNLDGSTAVSIGGVTYYPQATASTWQAEWRSNSAGQELPVIVDWGDSLMSKSYSTTSLIRIETVLKQDATIDGVTDTMTAYKMALISGTGQTELQGTSAATYPSAVRNVFAVNGRLTIEKLDASGGTEAVVFNKAVYESFGTTTEEGGGETGEGGGSGGSGGGGGGSGGGSSTPTYGVEINQGGSAVYGYNFRLGKVSGIANKAGQYRITFSLDPQATVGGVAVPNHVKMVNKADAGATLSPDGLSSSVTITVN